MNDYFLKFATQQDALTALATASMTVDDGFKQATHDYAIDIIGMVYKPTGAMLSGGYGLYPELQVIEGYHINIRMVNDELPASLQPFCVVPANPVRIFG